MTEDTPTPPAPLSAEDADRLTINLLSIVQHSNETSRRLSVADRRALARGIGQLSATLAAQAAEIARYRGLLTAIRGHTEADMGMDYHGGPWMRAAIDAVLAGQEWEP